ncbi:MAG TPA: hypothetical protein VKF39_05435 [Nitrososphaerales archaeon]|nr:hypothetical protein [Nitrososphaerales archaeon]
MRARAMAVGSFLLVSGATLLALSVILAYLGTAGAGYGFFTGSYLSFPYQNSLLDWLRFTIQLAYAGAILCPIGAAALAYGVGSDRKKQATGSPA